MAAHLSPTAAVREPTRKARSTRALLIAGAVAGPLYILLVVAQAPTRDGFDIRRHPASVLSNGDQGGIQIGNFLATGLLFVAFDVGLSRASTSTTTRGANRAMRRRRCR